MVFIAALGNCDSYSKYCNSTVPSQAYTKELIIFVHIELLHKIHSHGIHNSQKVGPIQKCQLADGWINKTLYHSYNRTLLGN